MSELLGKPRSRQNWLPQMVAYGIDCSSDDPEQWTAFGEEATPAVKSRKAWLSKPTLNSSSARARGGSEAQNTQT